MGIEYDNEVSIPVSYRCSTLYSHEFTTENNIKAFYSKIEHVTCLTDTFSLRVAKRVWKFFPKSDAFRQKKIIFKSGAELKLKKLWQEYQIPILTAV